MRKNWIPAYARFAGEAGGIDKETKKPQNELGPV